MGENSKIEWTTHTWNCWIGCSRVHEGCRHCYAESDMDNRRGRVAWGPHGTRSATSYDYWRKPRKWNRNAECNCGAAGSGGQQCDFCKGRCQRPRVFCASLADVFEDFSGQVIDAKKQPLWFDTLRDRDCEGIPIWSTVEEGERVPLTLDILRAELFKIMQRPRLIHSRRHSKGTDLLEALFSKFRSDFRLGS